MSGSAARLALVAWLALAGCVDNTAPGNDREASLDPPPTPARLASAESATAGVDVSLLHPQIITGADRAALPDGSAECAFRFTRVGYPAFLHGSTPGAPGVMKLNGKLVTLEAAGDGSWAGGGVTVRLRTVDGGAEGDAVRPTELVLMLPGARDELGYRGFGGCGAAATVQG